MYLTQPSAKNPRATLLGWLANTKEKNLNQNDRSDTSHQTTEEEKQTEETSNQDFCSNDSSDESNLSNHLGVYILDNRAIDNANSSILEMGTTYRKTYRER